MRARKYISRLSLIALGLLCWTLASVNLAQQAANKHRHLPEGQRHQRQLVQQQQQQPATTACDLLFASSDNLANHCQCKDSIDAAAPGDFSSTLTPNDDDDDHHDDADHRPIESAASRVDQLACSSWNISRDLQLAGEQQQTSGLQIEHLNILANLSWPTQGANESTTTATMTTSSNNIDIKPLQIDQVSLRLTLDTLADRQSAGQQNSGHYQAMIERQMIDFVQSATNGSHLQSLSLLLMESNNRPNGQQPPNEARLINVTRLLDGLTNLSRLEVSLSNHGLLIEPETFGGRACKLKWLNLASNERLHFVSPRLQSNDNDTDQLSPFTICPRLEHLSLESNNLEAFHLYSMFQVPFKVDNAQYFGQPSLTLLNLANNRLASFEDHLFSSTHPKNPTNVVTNQCQPDDVYVFLLPALIQLDLSGNQLKHLRPQVGQLILCTMPNLNQLYLQHNKLLQLSLNSLMSYPIGLPGKHKEGFHGLASNNDHAIVSDKIINSKLDLIDVGHNNLVRLLGWPQMNYNESGRGSPRAVKSINLSHNKLERFLDLVDITALDELMFDNNNNNNEFVWKTSGNDLANYQLKQTNNSLPAPTLCELLAQANSVAKKTQKHDDDGLLLNELIINNNRLGSVGPRDLSGKFCQDLQILHLDGNQIVTVHPEALKDLNQLEQLDLSENNLKSLATTTFINNGRLKILNLSKNKIKLLHGDIFLNLLQLEELLLNENELEELPVNLLAKNNQLTIVDLSNNQLTYLETHSFAHLKQLKLLNLDGNKLREFNQQLFIPAKNTIQQRTAIIIPAAKRRTHSNQKQSINSNNSAKKVSKKSAKKRHNKRAIDSQEEPEELEGSNVLILSSNKLRTITFDECDINFVKQVRFLWLNNNELRELSSGLLKCFTQVQSLYVQSNGIETVDELALSHLSQLETIDLSHNKIVRVRDGAMSYSRALRQVYLNENKLIGLNVSSIFASDLGHSSDVELMQLELLNLDNNIDLKIYANDLLALMSKSMLRHVSLSNISSIWAPNGDDRMQQQEQLKDNKLELDYLDLSSIERVDEVALVQLSHRLASTGKLKLGAICSRQSGADTATELRLQAKLVSFVASRLEVATQPIDLDLSGNQLTSKHIAAMLTNHSSSIGVSSLSLQWNSIERWPFSGNSSERLAHLKLLDLSKNKLRYLASKNNNSNDSSSLQSYDFPLLQTLNLSSNLLISLTEETRDPSWAWLDMPHLQHLDLSHNKLTWIPSGLFQQMNELQSLYLDHNQLEVIPWIERFTSRGLLIELSFNAKLKGTEQSWQQKQKLNKLVDSSLVDTADGLIVVLSDDKRVRCMASDEFLHSHHATGPQVANSAALQIIRELSMVGGHLEDQDDYHRRRPHKERCRLLLAQTDTIILDSTFVLQNSSRSSASFVGQVDRFKFVSVRHSGLERLELSKLDIVSSPGGLIGLDVAFNGLQSAPSALCAPRARPRLRSLSLSHNQLSEYPPNLSTCKQLTYLDLSHNKITVLPPPQLVQESLQVLILSFNRLKLLSGAERQTYYPLLALFDIRFNEAPKETSQQAIKPDKTSPLTTLVPTDTNVAQFANSSSLISSTHDKRSASSVEQQAITTSNANKLDQTSNSSSEDPVLSFIEQLRSCWLKMKTWNLYEQLLAMVNVQSDSILMTINGSYQIHTLLVIKVAIVFASICIVILLVAMFALLTVLSSRSNLKKVSDSTCKVAADDDDDNGALERIGEEHEFANNDTSNGSSLIDQTSTRSTSKQSSQTNATNSSDQQTKLASLKSNNNNNNNSRANTTTMQTVIERTTNNNSHQRHQLDASQLMQHQQQVCSTPTSSSLAPSSVETGETMQAVDSIQSGASNCTQHYNNSQLMFAAGNRLNSVDQYDASYNDYASQLGANNNNNNNKRPVATVMRMVKSSSTGFDKNNNNNNNHNDHFQQPSYGTLNVAKYNANNANYSATLKARMKAIQEQHYNSRYQLLPINGEIPGASYYTGNLVLVGGAQNEATGTTTASLEAVDNQQNADCALLQQFPSDIDPTTLSLLSLNTVLSGSNLQTGSFAASQQAAPLDQTPINANQSTCQQRPLGSNTSIGSNLNLCHFHKLIQDQAQPGLLATEVILEQDEEHQFNGSMVDSGRHHLLYLDEMPSPPPPPPPS